jgi:hypothetical protein
MTSPSAPRARAVCFKLAGVAGPSAKAGATPCAIALRVSVLVVNDASYVVG